LNGSTAWIMTASDALVGVDLERLSHARIDVHPLATDEHAWGLAIAAGELWTLVGRTTLAHLNTEGVIVQRIPLKEPHVGLFGGGAELLYQVMNFQPPADAL